jgi:hypothetical protein
VRQMGTDCSFLEASRVMDYSLLLGIHYRDNKDSAVPPPLHIHTSEPNGCARCGSQ